MKLHDDEWLYDDWHDLHFALEWVRRRVFRRHMRFRITNSHKF